MITTIKILLQEKYRTIIEKNKESKMKKIKM